ncbi:MAG: hypothetical protein WA628_22040 [Terriglobales bacterium]
MMALLLCFATKPLARAAEGEDLDVYKFRTTAVWWFSRPTGSFTGKANSGTFDLSRDFGFGDYSTFSGTADWSFKRKHHLLFGVSPVLNSRKTTLNRAIEFQGVTYDVGTETSAEIKSLAFAPGYQYDIMRRNRISLSIAIQVYLTKTSADLTGTTTANGQTETKTSSGSFFAPLPILGPRARWYPFHTGRFAVDGSFQGMSFFGYGNFMTARGTADISLSRHWRANLGYQMGTRLIIDTGTNEIGIHLTQKGPIAGFEASW